MASSSGVDFDVGRNKDFLYRVLHTNACGADSSELDRCVAGLSESLQDYKSCHPTLYNLIATSDKHLPVVKVAIVLFALHVDASFFSFVCSKSDACSACVSLFKHKYLEKHVEDLLNGRTNLSEFVGDAKVDYICG